MDLKTFKENLEILNEKEGNQLREKYIETFIDINSESYKKQIKIKHEFNDGYCYLGYLWDYLKNPIIIDKSYIAAVAKGLDDIYVFGDIHTCERIFTKNYWKFGKTVVLKLKFETLLKGEEYLPEDIYIFDHSFTWTVIKTHEDINGKCYCLKSHAV